MLPDEAAAHTSVLGDPTAAAAIMRITDIAVCKASFGGLSRAARPMNARIIVEGAERLLCEAAEDAACKWLRNRGVVLPAAPRRNKQDNYYRLKALDLLIEHTDDGIEQVKFATERLQRIINDHAS